METTTDATLREDAGQGGATWRGLWSSWWDGAWPAVAQGVVGAVILAPMYLLSRVLPETVTRVAGPVPFVTAVLIVPVVASRAFRALDGTRPWDRNRP